MPSRPAPPGGTAGWPERGPWLRSGRFRASCIRPPSYSAQRPSAATTRRSATSGPPPRWPRPGPRASGPSTPRRTTGPGLSERRIGEFLAGRPRDEFTVCTKVGRLLVPASRDVEGADEFYGTPPLTRVRDYSRDGVRRSLEDSLRRLGLDRVDIALIHDPDDFLGQAADEAYPALAELRAQGTVRAVGAGMNSAEALTWLVERSDLDCVLVAGRYHPARPVRRGQPPAAVRAPQRGGAGGRGVQQRHPGQPGRRHPLRLRPGSARRAGPRPPDAGGLRRLRRPAGHRRAAVHPAPPRGDCRRGGRPHPGGDHSRRRVPGDAHTGRAVGGAGNAVTRPGRARW